MGKLLKRLALLVAVIFVVLQFFRSERTNPPVDPSLDYRSRLTVPPAAAEVLERACRDCHTHETRWPWYSKVAPSNGFVVGHVDDARRHLNLSEFGAMPPKKAAHKLEEICEEAKERKMPLPSYLWLHRDAQVTDEQIAALCDWSMAAAAALKPAAAPAAPASPTPEEEESHDEGDSGTH